MRKMLLSFKPAIYDKIHEGIKIYEHRRNFPDEPILAYMYDGYFYCSKENIERRNVGRWIITADMLEPFEEDELEIATDEDIKALFDAE